MKTLEEIKNVIEEVEELQHKYNEKVHEVLEYAGLEDKYNEYMDYGDVDEAEYVYDEAVNRIEDKYLPDDEHMETYIGGHDVEPVTFDEIRRLYDEWDIQTDFETFFSTWVEA